MNNLKLFRKRLIPDGCILLKDDVIIHQSDDHIITTWTTLNPKIAFHHGSSCYFLKEGFKLSKFYRADGSLLYWYCDIVDYTWADDGQTLISTDLLADLIVYPDKSFKVLDLDELAEAGAKNLITQTQMQNALRQLDKLLCSIYKDQFREFQTVLDELGV